MNKEELKYSYLEYSPDITNEVFDGIILKLKDLGFIEFSTNNGYANFSKDGDSKLILSPNFEYYVSDGDIYDRTRLKVSDILGEETKFEVGKWYSFYWNWGSGCDIVAKVSKLGEVVRFDNFINITQGGHLDQSSNSISLTEIKAEIKNIKELTLEEIQQYLPDGHIDKLPRSLTVDDLVKGEIYRAYIGGCVYLFRAINKEGGYNLCLIINSKSPELFREAKSISWDKI